MTHLQGKEYWFLALSDSDAIPTLPPSSVVSSIGVDSSKPDEGGSLSSKELEAIKSYVEKFQKILKKEIPCTQQEFKDEATKAFDAFMEANGKKRTECGDIGVYDCPELKRLFKRFDKAMQQLVGI